MERKEVYAAIDSERNYQELWKKYSPAEGIHDTLGFLVFIRDYAEEALHIMSREPEPQCTTKAKDIMRKIGALAVASMEHNGVIPRGPIDEEEFKRLHNIK